MNSGNDFEQIISEIDTNLALKGCPVRQRVLLVLKVMYRATYENCLTPCLPPNFHPRDFSENEPETLMQQDADINCQRDLITDEDIVNVYKVYDWYKGKYPEIILNSFGYKPFLLEQKIYHIRINLDWVSDQQQVQQKLKELIYNNMNQLEDDLVENNLGLIHDEFKKGRIFYMTIHMLEMRIEEEERIHPGIIDLLAAGIYDINISLSAFTSPFYLNPQPIMFHAQQAVEKFLKSLYAQHKLEEIRSSGTEVDKYVKDRYKHDIDKLRQDLNDLVSDFNTIDIKVQELHTKVPSMDIRYKNSGKTTEDAIHCIDLMMEICSYVAKNFLALLISPPPEASTDPSEQ